MNESDAVRSCPDCDRPNQFGQLCEVCHDERAEDVRAARDWDDDAEDCPTVGDAPWKQR